MFQVLDRAFGGIKFTGRSKAIVTDNIDPQKRGRIRIDHPLLGDDYFWIPYLTVPGMYSVPRIGDLVYVEADCGEIDYIIAWGNATKKGGGAVPDAFLRHEPTNRGMYSIEGHLFEMDDGQTDSKTAAGIRFTTVGDIKFYMIDDEEAPNIELLDKPGNGFKLDSKENIWKFTMADGAELVIDGANDLLSLTAKDTDTISVSKADGIQMSTPASGGTSASYKSGNIDLTAAQGFTIKSDKDVGITAGAKLEFSAASGFTLSSDADATISAQSEMTLEVGGGSIKIGPTGVSLTGATGELLTIIEELLDALTAAVYPGFGAPASNVAQYPVIKAKITGMKA